MSRHLILGKHSAKSYWQMQVFTGQILLQATLFHASQETVLIPVEFTVKVLSFKVKSDKKGCAEVFLKNLRIRMGCE